MQALKEIPPADQMWKDKFLIQVIQAAGGVCGKAERGESASETERGRVTTAQKEGGLCCAYVGCTHVWTPVQMHARTHARTHEHTHAHAHQAGYAAGAGENADPKEVFEQLDKDELHDQKLLCSFTSGLGFRV